MLFTASSVRVDRRGTCSIDSIGAAVLAGAGSRHRYRVRSQGATWKSARAALGRAAEARAPAGASWRSPAGTCAAPTVASTGTRIESG